STARSRARPRRLTKARHVGSHSCLLAHLGRRLSGVFALFAAGAHFRALACSAWPSPLQGVEQRRPARRHLRPEVSRPPLLRPIRPARQVPHTHRVRRPPRVPNLPAPLARAPTTARATGSPPRWTRRSPRLNPRLRTATRRERPRTARRLTRRAKAVRRPAPTSRPPPAS